MNKEEIINEISNVADSFDEAAENNFETAHTSEGDGEFLRGVSYGQKDAARALNKLAIEVMDDDE